MNRPVGFRADTLHLHLERGGLFEVRPMGRVPEEDKLLAPRINERAKIFLLQGDAKRRVLAAHEEIDRHREFRDEAAQVVAVELGIE